MYCNVNDDEVDAIIEYSHKNHPLMKRFFSSHFVIDSISLHFEMILDHEGEKKALVRTNEPSLLFSIHFLILTIEIQIMRSLSSFFAFDGI